jgi:hypothetical protein
VYLLWSPSKNDQKALSHPSRNVQNIFLVCLIVWLCDRANICCERACVGYTVGRVYGKDGGMTLRKSAREVVGAVGWSDGDGEKC